MNLIPQRFRNTDASKFIIIRYRIGVFVLMNTNSSSGRNSRGIFSPSNAFKIFRQSAAGALAEVCNRKLWSNRLAVNRVRQLAVNRTAVVIYIFVRIAVVLSHCRCCQVWITSGPYNFILASSCCVRKSAIVRQLASQALAEVIHLKFWSKRLVILTNSQFTIRITTTTLNSYQHV